MRSPRTGSFLSPGGAPRALPPGAGDGRYQPYRSRQLPVSPCAQAGVGAGAHQSRCLAGSGGQPEPPRKHLHIPDACGQQWRRAPGPSPHSTLQRWPPRWKQGSGGAACTLRNRAAASSRLLAGRGWGRPPPPLPHPPCGSPRAPGKQGLYHGPSGARPRWKGQEAAGRPQAPGTLQAGPDPVPPLDTAVTAPLAAGWGGSV